MGVLFGRGSGRSRALWVLVGLLLIGSLRGDVPDEDDYADEGGDYESAGQGDPAYEQYAERLQQQLESLRKEHDVTPSPPRPTVVVCVRVRGGRVWRT